MTQLLKVRDPSKALEYFEKKVGFTTGPVELDDWIKNKMEFVIIDVRAVEDFAEGHIPGALNLPEDQWKTLKGLRKDRVNVLSCYSLVCHLAARAAVEFARQGFPVMELDGGFNEWKEHDLEIEKGGLGAGESVPLERSA